MRAVSVLYNGMFDTQAIVLPLNVTTKSQIKEDSPFHCRLKESMGDHDLVSESIQVKGQKYSNGDLVVLCILDCDNLEVGLIKAVLIKGSRAFFIVQRYKAKRNIMQYFVCRKPSEVVLEIVECHKLVDFKPLMKRGTQEYFCFVLHHFISFDYK